MIARGFPGTPVTLPSKGHGHFDACRLEKRKLLQSSKLNCQSSDSVLHHIAGICLFLIKDHVRLMNLLLVVMAVDHTGLHYDGVIGAR